ncbi:MAG: DUF6659 family protein [Candidatus Nitrosomaritimum yanchengensis]
MLAQTTIKSFDEGCDSLLINKKLRYIGILDKMGNLIFEKEQQGISSTMSDKKSRSLYIQSVLEILLQKDFDEQIGSLKYDVSHRTKMDIITIPVFDHVILISVEPKENTDLIANNAIDIFDKIFDKNNYLYNQKDSYK